MRIASSVLVCSLGICHSPAFRSNWFQVAVSNSILRTPRASNSFRAAAVNTQWSSATGFYEILTDKPGQDSWPITGATFVLMHQSQENSVQALEVLKFFEWAYKTGDKTASDLDYVPMPDSVKETILKSWTAIQDTSGKAIAYK